MKEIGIMFQPTVMQPLDMAQQSANKDPSTMDDAQIAQIMEAAPLMRQLLEGVEKEALRRLETGGTIPGLKPVTPPAEPAKPSADAATKPAPITVTTPPISVPPANEIKDKPVTPPATPKPELKPTEAPTTPPAPSPAEPKK
jgi:hypothetical protein